MSDGEGLGGEQALIAQLMKNRIKRRLYAIHNAIAEIFPTIRNSLGIVPRNVNKAISDKLLTSLAERFQMSPEIVPPADSLALIAAVGQSTSRRARRRQNQRQAAYALESEVLRLHKELAKLQASDWKLATADPQNAMGKV
ncbi:hypothetical protein EV178_002183 [Coemansia sp. RSA 1646]|nr:hypothetical protein EV178_002183 [Coemansia sp. RSA 1646]